MRGLMMYGAIAAVMLSVAASPARADDFLDRLLGQHRKGEYWDWSKRQHAQDWRWRQARGPRNNEAVVRSDPVDKE